MTAREPASTGQAPGAGGQAPPTAEEMLLRAQHLECLRTLAEGITHSLNNAFAPILLATDLLRSKLPAPGDRDILDSMEQSVRRGTELVRQVLGFARAVDGERARIEVRHLIRALSQLVRSTTSGDVKITTAYPEEIWPVEADAPQIFQALIGLCMRGREELRNGGSIRIDAANLEVTSGDASIAGRTPGPYVCLTVAALHSDAELGEPVETVNLDDDWERIQSQGLALAAASAIAESHGGWLVASRWPDKGMVCRFGLPAIVETEALEPVAVAAGEGVATGRVLIADEDENTALLAETILADAGFLVEVVEELEAVPGRVQEVGDVAALVLDVGHSPKRAERVLAALREIAADLPVIVTDGRPDRPLEGSSDRTDLPLDPELYEARLLKPYSAPRLLRAVAGAFAR